MSAFDKVLTYCPRCGAEGLILNSSGGLLCSGCDLEFFFNTAAAVAALITDSEGRLLMTVRKNDPGKAMLDLPGGFVNHDESAEDALRREVFEELGIEIINLRYFGSWPNSYVYSGLEYKTLDLAFIADIADDIKIVAGDDVSDFVFIYPEEIMHKDIAFDSIKFIVSSFLGTAAQNSRKA